jgi:hypothetical protein
MKIGLIDLVILKFLLKAPFEIFSEILFSVTKYQGELRVLYLK